MVNFKPYFASFFLLLLSSAPARASTEQLPAGVGAFVMKYINADIPNSYGKTGNTQDFSVKETLGADIIKSISPDVKSAYDQLSAVDPQSAANINLGSVDLEPKIHVTAQALGVAWGLTDNLMVAAGVPVLHGDITINGGYTNSGSVSATANHLMAMTNPNSKDMAHAMAQILQQLPTIKGEYLQGVIVNNYHYKPIGDWSGSGLGDTQTYAQLKVADFDHYKQALKLGMDIPTGHPSDPDSLVSIPFGQGYFDNYIESLHDFALIGYNKLVLGLSGRYQYSWATTQTYRLAPSTSFPLSDQEEAIHYKPGNAWAVGAGLSTTLSHELGFSISYSIKEKAQDSIQGTNTNYDYSILEYETNTRINTVDAELSYSTVDLFRRHKFPLPGKFSLEYSTVVSGLNTQQINEASANLSMYF